MSAIYSFFYGRVSKLFCCFSCPSISPAQEIILVLTHLEAFQHQNVESIGVVLMQNQRNFSQNYSLWEGTQRSGEGGISGGVQDMLHSQGKAALVLDVGHEIPCPLLPALLGPSVAPFHSRLALCSSPPCETPGHLSPKIPSPSHTRVGR